MEDIGSCQEFGDKLWSKAGILLDRNVVLGLCAAIKNNKNIMLAGVPGTAKTMTAKAISQVMFGGTEENRYNNKYHRITATPGITRNEFFGDWNYHKQFLEIEAGCSNKTCTADNVVETVYRKDNFIPGPALEAIQNNGILFIDEGNRGGEDFQNMVLEVAEEKQVTVPMLGTIKATEKGRPITLITYNEHDIGTEPFSDAFKRRFYRVQFKLMPRAEQETILANKNGAKFLPNIDEKLKKVLS
jgi:MoxR-like ATPase